MGSVNKRKRSLFGEREKTERRLWSMIRPVKEGNVRTALSTIQSFHKLGRVLSAIVFVTSILVFVFSLACAVLAAFGLESAVYEMFSVENPLSSGMLYYALSSTIIAALAEIIVSRAALKYFKAELVAGTPFKRDNAVKLKNLGILNIVLPIIVVILKSVFHMVLRSRFGDIGENEYNLIGSVAVGFMFIVLSLVCRYGSEIDDDGRNNQGVQK